MADADAVLGGWPSGHCSFRENYRADSGLIAAVVVLEQLSRADVPLSEVLAPFHRYRASGEINSRVTAQDATIEEVSAAGGVGELEDGWLNGGPTNPEPLLRLNVEARTEELLKAKTEEVLEII